jgi:hypothetical protein
MPFSCIRFPSGETAKFICIPKRDRQNSKVGKKWKWEQHKERVNAGEIAKEKLKCGADPWFV